MKAFWAWLTQLFSPVKALPSEAMSEAEEKVFPSPTYGVPMKSSTKVLSSGQDKDEATIAWYRKMYNAVCMRTGKESLTKNAAQVVINGQLRYEKVSKATGVPWFVIGVIHYKEASSSFLKVLHNGELLSSVNVKGTTLVPKGRGKGQNWTWEEAAIDAINMNGGRWAKIKAGAKDIGTILAALESYNGTGYISGAGRVDVSAYLWDGTTVYDGFGRYVSDGKFSATSAGDKSAGCAGILRYLEGLKVINVNSEAMKDLGPIPSVPPVVGPESMGEGLIGLAKLIDLEAAMDSLIKFQESDRPGRNPRYWAIMDVAKHSSKKRFHVFDRTEKSVMSYAAAHGAGSDLNHDGLAESFSNVPGSNATSLGFYRVAETYIGKHGLSCKLDGKSFGLNTNARSRAIVLHGASYVEDEYIKTNGKAGRSQGCPAVSDTASKDLIQKLCNGSPLYIVNNK